MSAYIKSTDKVLDVGCGSGGDIHKWNQIGCNVFCIDPNKDSIIEANKRLSKLKYKNIICKYEHIYNVYDVYNVICYNFSLQYIFHDEYTFNKTIHKIKNCILPEGLFIGVVPDSEYILQHSCKWKDCHGNTIEIGPSVYNEQKCGQMALVYIKDAPYYANGPIPEPLCHKNILIDSLKDSFILIEWSPLWNVPDSYKSNSITRIYSRFVFKKI